ncbi:MAG: hypothetical protein A3E07_02635 [Candidatus Wildermuthbacteria bacterium RIFCSPHIGHO2_12_FULL_45_9]|nr:MAG: hypothetical protein A3E07_02635 [Candidatus Wildermuthbacteria bacterium RIFCSPHIGHO2_12_FULL_45_9]
METTSLKVKNGIIKLPKDLQKAWQQADVLIYPSDDTLIVKRVQKSKGKLSDIAKQTSLPPLSQKEMVKEITTWRKEK